MAAWKRWPIAVRGGQHGTLPGGQSVSVGGSWSRSILHLHVDTPTSSLAFHDAASSRAVAVAETPSRFVDAFKEEKLEDAETVGRFRSVLDGAVPTRHSRQDFGAATSCQRSPAPQLASSMMLALVLRKRMWWSSE